MNKYCLLLGLFFSLSTALFGQASNEKILFVIDSIPLLNNPENWNQLLEEEVADITVVKNKDSLKLLGFEKLDGVTYIFTKQYRNRSDSLKRIPSLKQMEMKNDVWNLHGIPYSGKYIDYYNSGRIQDEGILLNGKLNGELIVYFLNGNIKYRANYKDGAAHGAKTDYYKNGAVLQTREFTDGKPGGTSMMYFITGQIEHEKKLKKGTPYDTAIAYYSTGKVKQMKLFKNGFPIPGKKEQDVNYYTHRFNQGLNEGDIKEANKYNYKLSLIDSTSADAHFRIGILLLNEFRFDKAIAEFDKALEIEPLMRESLQYRGIARIKKYRFLNPAALSKDSRMAALELKDLVSIPKDEQDKICNDIQQADYLDTNEYFIKELIPKEILDYCKEKNSR